MPWRAPLLTAASCVSGMALLALLALRTSAGSGVDHAVLRAFVKLDRGPVNAVSLAMTPLGEALPAGAACLALAGVAAARGDAWRALATVAVAVASGLSTVLLQHLLATPRFEPVLGQDQVGATAFPSGHTSAAAMVAGCAVLVAQPAARRVTAIAGGAFALAMGVGLLITGEHYPSDVLGSYLLVTGWTCVAMWALSRRPARAERGPGPESARAAPATVSVAGAGELEAGGSRRRP
jgi:membrane-associated phospholipid phosphatase